MHRITVDSNGPVRILVAEGELDAFVAGDLTAAFEEIGESSQVVADLTAVSFLDSTALGLVVRGVRRLGEHGAGVRVVLPLGTAAKIFELTTLDRVLPVSGSRDEALAELRD